METHGLLPDMCFSVQEQPGHQNVPRMPVPPPDVNIYPTDHQPPPVQDNGGHLGNEETDPKDSFVWQHESTLLLISLYRVNQHLFLKGSVKKKSVWILISKKMKEIGQNIVSPAQCENKWKSLTAAYRKVADHNSKQGPERKTCPYFNEISDLYGYQPKVTPNIYPENTNVQTFPQHTSGQSSTIGQNTNKKKGLLAKKRHSQNAVSFSDLVQTLKEYSEQRRKDTDAHLIQMKQMHNEKMVVLKGILEVLKSLRK